MPVPQPSAPAATGSPPDLRRATFLWLTLAAAACGLALRLVGLDRSIWLDEAFSIAVAANPDLLGGMRGAGEHQPPLYFLLLRAWGLLGSSVPVLRLSSVLVSLGLLAVLHHWLGRHSRRAALAAAWLWATTPLLVRYGQEIRCYGLLVLATAVAFLAAERLAARPRDRLGTLLLTAALCLAVATHAIGLLLLPPVALWLLCAGGRVPPPAGWWRLLPGFALPFLLPVILAAVVQIGYVDAGAARHDWWMPALSVEHVAATFKYTLGLPALLQPARLLTVHQPGILPMAKAVLATLLLGGLALVSVCGAWRRHWPLAAAAALYVAEVLLCSAWFAPILYYRILLPAAVPALAFTALQFASLRPPSLRRGAATLGVGLGALAALGWLLGEARTPYEDWKGLTAELRTECRAGDLLVVYPVYSLFAVRCYWPDIPERQLFGVPLDVEPRVLEGQFAARRRGLNGGDQTRPAAWLLTRHSRAAEDDLRTCTALPLLLSRQFGPPGTTDSRGILSLTRYGPPGSDGTD